MPLAREPVAHWATQSPSLGHDPALRLPPMGSRGSPQAADLRLAAEVEAEGEVVVAEAAKSLLRAKAGGEVTLAV